VEYEYKNSLHLVATGPKRYDLLLYPKVF